MARREAWLLQPGSRMPHSDRISKLSREGEEERLELAQDLASVRAKADSWKRRAGPWILVATGLAAAGRAGAQGA